ncbi:MAG: hypothetical protein QOF89_863 [Acidobacteriota bacterium]|nr:hypothetical protein [Acidobacteriota bacterium]
MTSQHTNLGAITIGPVPGSKSQELPPMSRKNVLRSVWGRAFQAGAELFCEAPFPAGRVSLLSISNVTITPLTRAR